MKLFLVGATGFIGSFLVPGLLAAGHEATLLVWPGEETISLPKGVSTVMGDPRKEGEWQEELARHEGVINLAGASIFQRWTKRAKHEIWESRMAATGQVARAVVASSGRTRLLMNASGIGYYGFSEERIVDEESPSGDTFLARLARSWEETAMGARARGARVVLCRFGIVMGKGGGAFTRIRRLARLRLGSPWGRGSQWFSWIHEEDCIRAFSFLLKNPEIEGPVNFTSPFPLVNREMLRLVNEAFHVKALVPAAPEGLINFLLGEFATEFLKGQRVLPRKLESAGFEFAFPGFREAIGELARSRPGGQ